MGQMLEWMLKLSVTKWSKYIGVGILISGVL